MRDSEQIAADCLNSADTMSRCLVTMPTGVHFQAAELKVLAGRFEEAAEALRHTPDARLIDGANKATRLREEAEAERDALIAYVRADKNIPVHDDYYEDWKTNYFTLPPSVREKIEQP